jgi:hypothetical protein
MRKEVCHDKPAPSGRDCCSSPAGAIMAAEVSAMDKNMFEELVEGILLSGDMIN